MESLTPESWELSSKHVGPDWFDVPAPPLGYEHGMWGGQLAGRHYWNKLWPRGGGPDSEPPSLAPDALEWPWRLGEPEPLLPSRNNSQTVQRGEPDQARYSTTAPAFRFPRAYVQACCKGTLGLAYESGRVVFRALACGSWSCPTCRRQNAARLLDRLRRGLEGRDAWRRHLLTYTVDPAAFGGVVIGSSLHEDGRQTRLYAPPSEAQYRAVTEQLSKEWNRVSQSVRGILRHRGEAQGEYFRVIELHRNGWPHYHVVWMHPHLTAPPQLLGWRLGRVDCREDLSIADAVGEVAPYLVNPEGRGKGYQFAASALPEHFRLWSASRGMLGAVASEREESPVGAVALRGTFVSYRAMYLQHLAALELPSSSLDLVHVPKQDRLDHWRELPSSGAAPYLFSSGGALCGFQPRGAPAQRFFADVLTAETLAMPDAWLAVRGDLSARAKKDQALAELLTPGGVRSEPRPAKPLDELPPRVVAWLQGRESLN